MSDSLKPCPFCGHEEISVYTQYGRYGYFAWVECDLCGARSKTLKSTNRADSPEFSVSAVACKLLDAWNRRPADGN